MQYVTFYPRDANNSILPQGTQVTVYDVGTTTKSPLFNAQGGTTNNPVITGPSRAASFAAKDGVYDIAQQGGPTLTNQSIQDVLPNFLRLSEPYLYKKLTGSTSGWLAAAVPNTESEPGFTLLSPNGQSPALFASQTVDNPNYHSEGCQGATFFALNNNANPSGLQTAYGWYAEARRYPGASTTHSFESNIVNLGSVVDLTPFGSSTDGLNVAGWFSSGRPDVANSQPSSAVAGVINNTNGGTAPFRRGFVFLNNSLDTSIGEALTMPTDVGLAWYNKGGNTPSASIKAHSFNVNRVSLAFYATDDAGNSTGVNLNASGNDAFAPNVDGQLNLGLAGSRWTNIYGFSFRPGSGAPIWTSGAGSPQNVVAAPVGSLYTDTNGVAGQTLYVKESGTGSSGWTAK